MAPAGVPLAGRDGGRGRCRLPRTVIAAAGERRCAGRRRDRGGDPAGRGGGGAGRRACAERRGAGARPCGSAAALAARGVRPIRSSTGPAPSPTASRPSRARSRRQRPGTPCPRCRTRRPAPRLRCRAPPTPHLRFCRSILRGPPAGSWPAPQTPPVDPPTLPLPIVAPQATSSAVQAAADAAGVPDEGRPGAGDRFPGACGGGHDPADAGPFLPGVAAPETTEARTTAEAEPPTEPLRIVAPRDDPEPSADRVPHRCGSSARRRRTTRGRRASPTRRTRPAAHPGRRRPDGQGGRPARSVTAGSSMRTAAQTRRRSDAQRESSYRFDSCVLRSTLDTCVSTVLTEMNSSPAISR